MVQTFAVLSLTLLCVVALIGWRGAVEDRDMYKRLYRQEAESLREFVERMEDVLGLRPAPPPQEKNADA